MSRILVIALLAYLLSASTVAAYSQRAHRKMVRPPRVCCRCKCINPPPPNFLRQSEGCRSGRPARRGCSNMHALTWAEQCKNNPEEPPPTYGYRNLCRDGAHWTCEDVCLKDEGDFKTMYSCR